MDYQNLRTKQWYSQSKWDNGFVTTDFHTEYLKWYKEYDTALQRMTNYNDFKEEELFGSL